MHGFVGLEFLLLTFDFFCGTVQDRSYQSNLQIHKQIILFSDCTFYEENKIIVFYRLLFISPDRIVAGSTGFDLHRQSCIAATNKNTDLGLEHGRKNNQCPHIMEQQKI